MVDPVQGMAVVTALVGFTLYEFLTDPNRPANQDRWPNSIPPAWPEEWRRKFSRYRPNQERTRAWLALKQQIERLEKSYRSKVRVAEWRTNDGVIVTLAKMTNCHLANAINYCKRKRNWGSWVLLVAEYRHRLKKLREKGRVHKSRLSIRELKRILDNKVPSTRDPKDFGNRFK